MVSGGQAPVEALVGTCSSTSAVVSASTRHNYREAYREMVFKGYFGKERDG